MKLFVFTVILAFVAVHVRGLPVTKTKKPEDEKPNTAANHDDEMALEYERYLKEVVETLESDPDFRKKLDKADEADIRSGKIAQELEYVNHHVRTKLDEIKRSELARLRSLANKEFELSNDIDRNHMKIHQHVDHDNQHTFEAEDLRKLIMKTSEDLSKADQKRREAFKEYEMQKEFEKEMIKNEMSEEQRKKFDEEQKALAEKHKKHEKIHHPGNKAQLEEVWEEQDHMDKGDFDPHAFFMIHDVDGNGFWDEVEVKALFVKELNKVYQSGLPEDDMRERAEEMERMREHVFQETDTNRDGLISFQEFLEQTKREEFNKDPEWHTVDEQPQYSHEEYLEFERRRKEEVDRMIAQGLLPPHPNMPQGYYADAHQQQQGMHYQNPQQQHMQQQQQYQQQQHQYQQQQQQYHQQQNQQQQYQQPQYQQPHQQQQNHQQQFQQQQYNPPQQQLNNNQQFQAQYNAPIQQQQQYNTQQVHLNDKQVYHHDSAQPQQQQPVVNVVPLQQAQNAGISNNQQPVASSVPPQQPNGNAALPQQQYAPNNNIPTHQQYQQPQPVQQQQQNNQQQNNQQQNNLPKQ